MAESLEWEFRLIDQVSGPAEKMHRSLKQAAGGFTELIHSFHDVEHVGEMTMRGLEKAVEFGEFVVEAQEWKEETLIGLRAVTGSAEEAARVFGMAQDFAFASGQSSRDLVDSAKELRMAGVSLEEIGVLQKALSDVGVFRGKAGMEQSAALLTDIASSGHFTMRQIEGLNRAAGVGGRMFDVLAKGLGMNRKQLTSFLKEGGDLGKRWGLFAFAKSVQEMSGTLGAPTKEASESFGRSMTSVRESFKKAITDLDTSEAMKPLSEGLRKVASEGIPAAEAGFRKTAPSVENLSDVFQQAFGRGTDLKAVMGGLGETAGIVANVFVEQLRSLSLLGEVYRTFKDDGFSKAFTLLRVVGGVAVDYLKGLVEDVRNIGSRMVDGLVGGIEARASKAIDSVIGLGNAAVGALKGSLGIHSPSAVFQGLGEMSAEGFHRGMTAGGIPVGRVRGGSGGGFSPTINLSVNVATTGTSATPDHLARSIKDVVIDNLTSSLEQVALEGGGN